MAFFRKRLGIFPRNFTCVLGVSIYARQHFIQLSATLTKLCHIKSHLPVHIMCAKCPPSAKCTLAFSDIFPKQLGIFSPTFTLLLNTHMHTRTKIFVQLSPSITKLCHIKCDHPACISVDGGHFENIMVVTLNMA